MPMSFLSVVKRSKAASIVAFSVLLSTTRKFFCESGGAVTCYSFESCALETLLPHIIRREACGTYANACEEESGDGVLDGY